MFGLVPFLRSTIGKKVLMALSGFFLLAFAVEHVVGTMLFLKGPDAINAYGKLLHSSPALIWTFRSLLLLAAAVHICAATQLYFQQLAARPVGYQTRRYLRASYAARTMKYTGPFLAAFVLFHLAHLTLGYNVVPGSPFVQGDIHSNMLNGFRTPWVSLVYISAVSLLGLHLLHGAHSMFESLGLRHRRIENWLLGFAKLVAVAVCVGLILAPVAVLAGMVGG
jgi:succinate dehydrogenase / fumarate reductase, cytochrome b subunit